MSSMSSIPEIEVTDAAKNMSITEGPADPWCDEKNPRIVDFEKISAAAYRIHGGIVKTPCDRSHIQQDGMEIYLKKDFMQYTGSFKERGARFTLMMLEEKQKKIGVIAASAGNHALALAYHGGQLGIPVTVVMPVVAPIMKVENCKRFGATVVINGADIGESREHALVIAKKKGYMYVNGFDHPDILAGQGTMGLEILEQVPDLDAAVIPVGGGGLIAGVAKAIKTMKPGVKIIGVEPERCPSFIEAMKAGTPVKAYTQPSLADGLTVPTVGCNALATAAPLIDKMVTVSEEWIAIAILRLVEMEKAVVEGGGASGVAAVLAGLVPELAGKKVVIPLCGGNIDTTILGRCLDRGLAADGRLVKFSVTVSDRPGGIAELAKTLCELGVSVKDMMHERAWIKNDIFSVEISCVVETKDSTQANHMKKVLEEKYEALSITSIGVALGVADDNTSVESEEDIDLDESRDSFSLDAGGSSIPRSPISRRKRVETFVENTAAGGLAIPIVGVNSGRRGSMLVQTHVKKPEFFTRDIHMDTDKQPFEKPIDWSTRGTHYSVKENH